MPGAGEGLTINCREGASGGDGNVLDLDRGDRNTTVRICQSIHPNAYILLNVDYTSVNLTLKTRPDSLLPSRSCGSLAGRRGRLASRPSCVLRGGRSRSGNTLLSPWPACRSPEGLWGPVGKARVGPPGILMSLQKGVFARPAHFRGRVFRPVFPIWRL